MSEAISSGDPERAERTVGIGYEFRLGQLSVVARS
jgi:hypothetical protein